MPSGMCCEVDERARMIPHEFPLWSTVWGYFRIWRKEGVWEQMQTSLREDVRSRQGREPIPSAVIRRRVNP